MLTVHSRQDYLALSGLAVDLPSRSCQWPTVGSCRLALGGQELTQLPGMRRHTTHIQYDGGPFVRLPPVGGANY